MAVVQPGYKANMPFKDENDGVAKPVDLVHLARMTMGDRSLEREVLNLFRSQSEICASRITKAENNRDFVEAVHAIKGSARGIGAWKVAEVAAEVELEGIAALKSGRINDLISALTEATDYISLLLRD